MPLAPSAMRRAMRAWISDDLLTDDSNFVAVEDGSDIETG